MSSLAYAVVWFFVFSIPWENLVVIPGLGRVSVLSGMVAAATVALLAAVSARIRRWHSFHLAALAFVAWTIIVPLVIYNFATLPDKLLTFAQLLVMVWMIWEVTTTPQRVIGLMTAYVLGSHVEALGTIILFARKGAALRRFAAGGGDANDLAMMLVLALPIAWYLGMTYRRPLLRWICRAYLPIGLLALGLTGSRGGMIAGAVGLLIVPLTMGQLSSGRRAVAIVMLVISAALVVTYVPESLIQRLETTSTEVTGEGGLSGRYKIWKAGAQAFALKPLVGYGTGNFKRAANPFGTGQVAHNSYLSLLVEQGLVGFLLYMTMVGAVFLSLLSLPHLERRFALVLLATLLVAMTPLTWADRRSVWIVLAVLVGLSQARPSGTARAAADPRPGRAVPLTRTPMVARSRESYASPIRNPGRDTRG